MTFDMYCPTHGPVRPEGIFNERSVDRCPVCEHALSFDPEEAARFARQDENDV